MSIRDDQKELLRKEISSLLDKISNSRVVLLSENSKELDGLLEDIALLEKKTAALQFLLAMPIEVPPTPPVKEPEQPKKEPIKEPEPVEEPVIVPPVVPPTEEKKKEPVAPPEIAETPPQEKKQKPGKQLSDIRSFIGFNEKLMFLRHLFRNDNAAYDEALEQVNNSTSFEEANAFIYILQAKYGWNSSSEPVQIFVDTVNRRFS